MRLTTWMRRWILGSAIVASAFVQAPRLMAGEAAPDAAGVEYFETHIRPVLVDKCYSCHSAEAKKLKGGLYLDTRAGVLAGGDSGPALVPGKPDESLLIKAIRYLDEDVQMPPKEADRLPKPVVDHFVAWVAMGAPDPRSGGTVVAKGGISAAAREHWSFQPPRQSPPPAVKRKDWVRTPIDQFILAKLEAKGLAPSPEADRRTLLRRAAIDLTGLPPSAEELDAFLADTSADPFPAAVDRLLASPRYGERWGRHWLDVARYADTKGYAFEEERRYPYSYTYRDWVIRAFNEDLPYDRFLIEQIAADRLPSDDPRRLAALGFLTLGRRFLNNEPDIIDDRIDTLTRGTLGLTVACARCHDHKFDPIPTKDYYSLYGVFANSPEPKDKPLIGGERTPAVEEYERELAKRTNDLDGFRAKRFAEVVAHMRTAPAIADYLIAAHDAAGKDDKELRDIAAKRKLQPAVLKRWRERAGKGDGKDALFAAWRAFAALPGDTWAEAAKPVAARFADPAAGAHPLLRAALAAPPASLRALAETYAGLIAGCDGAAPLPEADREALRLVLRGPGAPTDFALDKADEVFDGDDEKKVRELVKKIDELASTHPGSPPRAMSLEDAAKPKPQKVFIRGSAGNHGDEVPRQFLGILAGEQRKPFTEGSGRLELAKAIASPGNPLTARVMVNRVWQQHFGEGLVRTASDFGLRTESPEHRELLDWLALRFIADGWSVKKLHRLVMLSAAWRQAAAHVPASAKVDPENTLVWRMNRRRLDLEALRDGLLAAAGSLDLAMGGRSVELTTPPFTTRRTVYGFIERQNLDPLFRTFDFASPDAHSPQRYQTTVPQQALYMMNSPFAIEQATRLAARSAPGEGGTEARIRRLYRLAYGRAPTAEEAALGTAYLASEPPKPPAAPPSVWSYGYGPYLADAGRLERFTPLPHFTGKAWQGGSNLPDGKLGWATLADSGGHPSDGATGAVVRRWTAPRDGVVAVSGKLEHRQKEGDGVRAVVIASRGGQLAIWTAHNGETATDIARIEVKAGDLLDFVVDNNGSVGFDSFNWVPVVRAIGPDGKDIDQWNAAQGFGGPPGGMMSDPLPAWERYAQILLMSNEFAFVD